MARDIVPQTKSHVFHLQQLSLFSSLHAGYFSCICRLLIFFHNITFSRIAFRNTIGMSKLEPDQANHFVGPDLGPNCLQRLSVDDTIVFPGLK